MHRDDLEIIDGQQRIVALNNFAEGALISFHPVEDDSRAHFPRFLHKQPCPWAKKDFHSLTDDLKQTFLQTKIPIAIIETCEANEVRDLFVRLQAGLPLNPQEKRDAFPGDFTDFILRVGGKPEIARYPGHQFFQRVLKMKPGQDRGKTRTLAAQIAMLFFTRRDQGGQFTHIHAQAIDEFYYTNVDFDASSDNANCLHEILKKLDSLLGDGKRPKLKAHEAIHLVLLADLLWDDYTRSWESSLPDAVDDFTRSLAGATRLRYEPTPPETWLHYGLLARTNADNAETIRRRHEFYVSAMLGFLNARAPLTLKDSKRLFGSLEREVIYFRDQKRCNICKAEVVWADAEFHHVVEHSQGGRTAIENGVFVHRHCHPRGGTAS